jgi:hypothetical protein
VNTNDEARDMLATGLAAKAFKLLDRDSFSVSANLSIQDPQGLAAFQKLKEILLMAFEEGRRDTHEERRAIERPVRNTRIRCARRQRQIAVPDVLRLTREYVGSRPENATGGLLKDVLNSRRVTGPQLSRLLEQARSCQDQSAMVIVRHMQRMSKTQRRKLGWKTFVLNP